MKTLKCMIIYLNLPTTTCDYNLLKTHIELTKQCCVQI